MRGFWKAVRMRRVQREIRKVLREQRKESNEFEEEMVVVEVPTATWAGLCWYWLLPFRIL